MGRAGVSFFEISQICEQLKAQGENPSIDRVREKLGTGSRTTINNHIKTWKAKNGSITGNPKAVSETLLSLVSQLDEQLKLEANHQADERIEAQEIRHKGESDELNEKLKEAGRRHEFLTERNEQLHEKLTTAEQQVKDTDKQLKEQIEVRSKAEKMVEQQEDKIKILSEQIQSLEEKHKQARSSLEHFREAAKQQRIEDQKTFSNLQRDSQSTIDNLSKQLAAKSEQVTKLSSDNSTLSTQCKALNSKATSLQQDITKLENEAKQYQADAKTQSDKLFAQQEKLTELITRTTRLEIEAESASKAKETAESDKAKLMATLSETQRNYEDRIKKLQAEIEGQDEKIETLKQLNNELDLAVRTRKKKAEK
ncbi:DNA-binding protein [Endozoicomonas sp. ALC066]|uniref:DNA-binding protein n=1 Tax=Endozoicomonas sp. ALC066 TaxID=3403078 RepID=UPI003BB5D1F5